MRKIALLIAVSLLGACAGNNTYTKPGSTEASFKRDVYECDLETWRPGSAPAYASPAAGSTLNGLSQSLANLSGALADRGESDRRMRTCLELRGYRLETKR